MAQITHAPTRTFIVEGNIGAGKSTFLRIMNDYLQINPIFEPHEKWQHVSGEGDNLLQNFYEDTQRWAYTFQTYAFVTRVKEQEQAIASLPTATHVVERSVYSDRYCFAHNCVDMGTMSKLEWHLYKEWFEWLVENYTTKPTGFIYLQTDPEVCYKRLLKRNRSEEVSVSLDYLQSLHKRHEQWLIDRIDVAPYLQDIPVLVLETNKEFEDDVAQQHKHMSDITDFFNVPARVTPSATHTVHDNQNNLL